MRLDIPPPRTDDGQKYAFVEYKNPEDCEKALELDGKALPFAIKEGLTVQVARSDPFLRRTRGRPPYRGGFERGGRGDGYGGRNGSYGYPAPGGYGSRGRGPYGYGYEPRGGYLHGYAPYGGRSGGRDHGYGPYGAPPGGYMGGPMPYPRDYDSYGYRGYDDYRDSGRGYEPRDRYHDRERGDRDRGDRERGDRERGDRSDRDRSTRRRPSDRPESSNSGEPGSEAPHPSSSEGGNNEPAEYDRGRYPRADSPREKNRSRSPSR